MNKEIIKEVKRNVEELNYKGYEDNTFFDKNSEFHEDAYDEVLYDSVDNIVEEILDEANSSLSNSGFGDLAYEIILQNVEKKVENLVAECIDELYFNK